MNYDEIKKKVLKCIQKMRKIRHFDEGHDKRLPAQWWFQNSTHGLELFLVFYSQACRWSKCLGCNLPSKSSPHHVGCSALMAQVDYFFSLPEILGARKHIRKVILSNNGSILDRETFSSSALIYLLSKIKRHLTNVSVVTLETRSEYVDVDELKFLMGALQLGETPTELELAIGFEVFDERIRNEIFCKGLNFGDFEKLIEKAAGYGFGVKCYFMQKPVPGMHEEEASRDIEMAIDYLSDIASYSKVNISVHLNPTYAAAGTLLAESFRMNDYTPPRLANVARVASYARGKGVPVFIGLNDEGLAVAGGSFIRPGEESLLKKLRLFNRTADYSILEAAFAM